MPSVRFTQEDLELFSAASRDLNPLHLSSDYARRTSYGEPVVFGILGALAALGHTADRPGMALSGVTLDFRNPLFRDIDYRVQVAEQSTEQCLATIHDGQRLLLSAKFEFQPINGTPAPGFTVDYTGREAAAEMQVSEMQAGLELAGEYAARSAPLDALIERLGLIGKGVTCAQIAALLWTSYFVGMEMPGKRAAYSRLMLTFPASSSCLGQPLAYQATVKSFDERFDLLRINVDLSCGNATFAEGEIWSFVRRNTPVPSSETIQALLPASDRLAGKVALVIGGSRGLGAAICQALGSQGCFVILNYLRSREEAERVRYCNPAFADQIELIPGDASDGDWCQRAREEIIARHGSLDILVCSASPPIRPLGFAPETMERFQGFVSQSISLVAAPMAAFLDLLAERSGCCAIISSEYAVTAPPDFPHYVAAKRAIEGLAQAAAGHYKSVRFLVARPPKLLTDQTNTPMGRQGAIRAERAAAAIVQALCEGNPRTYHVLESF